MSSKANDLSDRLYGFALKIVMLVRRLPKELAAYEIGRQIVRSGTSIAANYEEAKGAFSKDDFIYKINTSFKEARETNMWLKLLRDSGIMKKEEVDDMIRESEEIRNILGKSVQTAKRNSV
ncbi:MAG: four helix bundle protein [Nitrospirae bacterium]|nr:MAG: four helix bundle protein [Nitrospirota bacterium]